MASKNYVVINGRAYNTITGMVMNDVDVKKIEIKRDQLGNNRGTAVSRIHAAHIQKSSTLNRRHVKKPQGAPLAARVVKPHVTTQQHVAVKKFAPATPKPAPQQTAINRPAETHPIIRRAQQRPLSTNNQLRKDRRPMPIVKTPAIIPQKIEKPVVKTAKELKNEAIEKALSNEIASNKKTRRRQKKGGALRLLNTFSVGFAVMLLGGYLTYLSMPNISIKMAAVQSGIDAKYPGYKPDGYALNGPIKFKSGEVTMRYAYADGSSAYTITQQKSNWNSSAVKEFFSEKHKSPNTTMIDGLTIYSGGKEAAWVNGGILYQISGDANLSSDQIQKIAASL
ncbi:MAG: DUF4367 domain-containing protein [Candidatus Saccharimonas sp.]|nr:MAG: DUF4367 domain-containing protein [Candidatus Saccharimonas sp.]